MGDNFRLRLKVKNMNEIRRTARGPEDNMEMYNP
jgi:hypothetical protein